MRVGVIGGGALIARGVRRATEDLAIAHPRDLARLAAALKPLRPRIPRAHRDRMPHAEITAHAAVARPPRE